VITANSNSPRTAATRWFIVDADAPRPDRNATTVPDDRGGADSQSKKSNTSIGVTAASTNRFSSQKRRKLRQWNAYVRTVNAANARTSKCDK
jgi:hypothetical protein